MAARNPALISEQEYLATAYHPDCEFEDGVLIERHVGTEKHSWLQAALAAYVFRRRRAWNVNVYTEQRARIRPGKYKLPDLCLVLGPRPATPIFEQPPLVAIEILSPEDRPLRLPERMIVAMIHDIAGEDIFDKVGSGDYGLVPFQVSMVLAGVSFNGAVMNKRFVYFAEVF